MRSLAFLVLLAGFLALATAKVQTFHQPHDFVAAALKNFQYSGPRWSGPRNCSNDGKGIWLGINDITIVGAGAAGMSLAAFAKDKNQKVFVIEKEADIGGYANTVYFQPPAPGYPAWLDIGVGISPNSSAANASGYGVWKLDTIAFANRFLALAAGAVVPLTNVFDVPRLFDFEHGIDYGLAPTAVSPDYEAAFARFYGTVMQYPFLNTGEWPDPIPAELTVSFTQWVTNNNFQILYSGLFYNLGIIGGFVDFDTTPALYVLANMPPSILDLFTRNGTIFTIFNGYFQLYDGIRNYIGRDNVLTSAKIRRVIRPPEALKNILPITLIIEVGGKLKVAQTWKLVIAHPQLLSDISYIDLDAREKDIFKHVSSYLYYAAAFNFTGGLLGQGQGIQVTNINPANAYGYPNWPGIASINRGLPYGPGGVFGCAKDPITNEAMEVVMQEQLSRMGPLIENPQISVYKPHEKFCPHFDFESIRASPNVYTRLENLQGYRSTFWIGALRNFANSGALWDQSFKFIEKYAQKLLR